MTTTLRISILSAALVLLAGCGGEMAQQEAADRVVEEWCAAVEELSQSADVFLQHPSESTLEEMQVATDRAEEFYATTPPDEVAEAITTLHDGPPSGSLEDTLAASRQVTSFIQANCDGIDPRFFEAAP